MNKIKKFEKRYPSWDIERLFGIRFGVGVESLVVVVVSLGDSSVELELIPPSSG